MERIKDLSKVVLRGDMVLAKLFTTKKKSNIVLTDAKVEYDYMEVITVGMNVTDIEPGDIIVEVIGNVDVYNLDEVQVARFQRGQAAIVTKPDNFDQSLKKEKFTSKIIH